MKWRVFLALLVAFLCIREGVYAQTPVIQIQRRMVIAFFAPAPKGGKVAVDSNEELSDFQFYARRVKEPLNILNIDFRVLHVRSFRLHLSKGDIVFRSKADAVGYYLIAPGKKPQIEYGVMTDADLLQLAKRYFGLPTDSE
jgi:hypothetical protein